MKDLLVLILSIIGIFALYWVFAGQRSYNKMMQQEELKRLVEEENKKKKNK